MNYTGNRQEKFSSSTAPEMLTEESDMLVGVSGDLKCINYTIILDQERNFWGRPER